MKPKNFTEQNTIFGKDQEGVQPLPAYAGNGTVTCCFELDAQELKHVADNGTLSIKLDSFSHPAQPVSVKAVKPAFPIDPLTHFMINPQRRDAQTSVFVFKIIPNAKDEILKHKCIWITVCTYGGRLQPIHGTVLPVPKTSKLWTPNGKIIKA